MTQIAISNALGPTLILGLPPMGFAGIKRMGQAQAAVLTDSAGTAAPRAT